MHLPRRGWQGGGGESRRWLGLVPRDDLQPKHMSHATENFAVVRHFALNLVRNYTFSRH